MRWCSIYRRCSMRPFSCARRSETPDDASRLEVSATPLEATPGLSFECETRRSRLGVDRYGAVGYGRHAARSTLRQLVLAGAYSQSLCTVERTESVGGDG